MKPIAFALLLVFLPTAAFAQNSGPQQRSSGKKLKWIALGSVIGGASLALVGVMSGKEATAAYVPTTTSNCTVATTGGSTVSAVACILTGFGPLGSLPAVGPATIVRVIPLPPTPGAPITTPGTAVAPMFGVPTSVVSLSAVHRSGPNWKMIVPAIGAASVGTFVLYRDHARTKRAELSVRPDGTAQLAFKW